MGVTKKIKKRQSSFVEFMVRNRERRNVLYTSVFSSNLILCSISLKLMSDIPNTEILDSLKRATVAIGTVAKMA